MILIADSGSTKTDWRLIDEKKEIHQFRTQGINPYFQTTSDISEILQSELLTELNTSKFPYLEKNKLEIHFYGAGCKAEDKKKIVFDALNTAFKNAVIKIESDLLGAAHALCGKQKGIVAILGTGSNTCYYDGKVIAENKTSTGFILGDEGSGAHIGKTLIQAYLNDEMPIELSKRFFERFKLSKDEIIDAVYKKPMPNRFLASFSKYVYQNLKEQYYLDLVTNCFNQFFDKHICKYSQYKEVSLNCVGSVAFYYSNILRAIATNRGIIVGTILESPIAALSLYYTEE